MKTWLWYALAATGLWGIWGFAAAKASVEGATTWGVLTGAVLIEALIALFRVDEMVSSWSWWIVLTGVTGIAAYYGMFKAFNEGGPGSSVVMITASYPLVTFLLAVVFMNESWSWRRAAAIPLFLGAMFLLNDGSH